MRKQTLDAIAEDAQQDDTKAKARRAYDDLRRDKSKRPSRKQRRKDAADLRREAKHAARGSS